MLCLYPKKNLFLIFEECHGKPKKPTAFLSLHLLDFLFFKMKSSEEGSYSLTPEMKSDFLWHISAQPETECRKNLVYKPLSVYQVSVKIKLCNQIHQSNGVGNLSNKNVT